MARLGINTGLSPNDGTGDTLLEGAVKINSNFDEIYTRFGDGDNLVGVATNLIGGDNIDVTSPVGNVVISVSAAATLTCTSVDIYEGGLTVGGISTLGIVTGAESINVTNLYSSFLYGDGSNLTGISRTDFTSTESLVVTGISTLGVITGADSIEVTNVYSTDIKTSSIDASSYTGNGSNLTGVLKPNAVASQLIVSGITTLGIVTNVQEISTGSIYANAYYGNGSNLSNVCKQSTAIADQLIVVGVSTLGIITGSPSIQATDVYATKLYGDGSNITGVGRTSNVSADTLVVTGVSTLGIVTGAESIQSTTFYGDGSRLTDGRWVIGANGTSGYLFDGVGFPTQEQDPDLYLARGRVYEFVNNMGAHPFRIQSTQNGSNGPLYSPGVTNNNTSSGTIRFEVPFNAPDTLWYQCSTHAGMGGTIFIYPTLR